MWNTLSLPAGIELPRMVKLEETILPFFFKMTETRTRLQVYWLVLDTVPEIAVYFKPVVVEEFVMTA